MISANRHEIKTTILRLGLTATSSGLKIKQLTIIGRRLCSLVHFVCSKALLQKVIKITSFSGFFGSGCVAATTKMLLSVKLTSILGITLDMPSPLHCTVNNGSLDNTNCHHRIVNKIIGTSYCKTGHKSWQTTFWSALMK